VKWERRFHPLRQEWVIVAAHRQERPWSGEVVTAGRSRPPKYVADCYLCPGNERVNGRRNEAYSGVFVFDNDLPCVGPDAPRDVASPGGVLRAAPAEGLARVVCYTPRHDLCLGELELDGVVALCSAWQAQYRELGSRPEVDHVLVFENRGEIVGVSNPHPHCQIYATGFVAKTTEVEVIAGESYHREHGRSLLGAVIEAEIGDGRRVIHDEPLALSFLPYFARYPYEAFVAPKAARSSIADLTNEELVAFARTLKDLLVRYDALWDIPFPYVLALHQAPTDGREHQGFHFHAELHPPLRKPNLRKYLAGPEIGAGMFLSDAAPEDKAAELRAVGTGVGS